MSILKKIALDIFKRPSLYLFIFLIGFSVDRANRWFDCNNGNFPFVQDVDQYYSYLPAAFIHKDLTFSFPSSYWVNDVGNGNKVPRGTIGMSLMYSPFFFIGHVIAKNSDFKTDGYSLPYKWSIHIGSILYSLFGLWFCRKNLLNFFNEYITLITLICVFFATNLFYYTYGYGEMPHAYLFFIFSLFIFSVIKWYQNKQLKYLLLFSFLAGIATLIRPIEFLILLFPLLFNVRSLSDFKERVKLFLSYHYKLLFAACVFILPFFIQMLYWKTYAGQWLFFSYGSKERFFFFDPQIINFLFSFRKGWLIYTPVMLFSVIGILLLKRYLSAFFYFSLIYFSLTVYILSSWWDWPFGGSFGCRALIHHYAFFIFSFATFVYFVFNLFKNKKAINYTLKTALCLVFCFFIRLNYHQSWQYKYGIIHYSGMTKAAYFYVFNKDSFTEQERGELEKLIDIPDPEALIKGDRD